MKKVNHIIIVGGGSSAWLTAAYLSHNSKLEITMVDKEEGKPIGVGESTLLNFKPFMDQCGFKFEEWFNALDATYKTGTLFPGWGKNKQAVWHPFQMSPMAHLGERTSEATTAFHVDCGKLVEFLQSQLKIKVIKSDAIQLDTEGLLLKNKQRLQADLFVDCTGFKSLLQDAPLTLLKDRLICDTAIAGRVAYQDLWREKTPYVVSEAVECGWIWKVPLQSRLGSGIVFNKTMTPISKAKEIFLDYWDQRVGPTKTIDWTPYYKKEFWKDNVVRIGLSAGFIEPLEGTGLALSMEGIYQLLLALNGPGYTPHSINIYNAVMTNFFEESINFISSHYTLNTRSEPFWNKARTQLTKSQQELLYSKLFKNPNQQWIRDIVAYSFFNKKNWLTWLNQQ